MTDSSAPQSTAPDQTDEPNDHDLDETSPAAGGTDDSEPEQGEGQANSY